jgi:hypothetical protein
MRERAFDRFAAAAMLNIRGDYSKVIGHEHPRSDSSSKKTLNGPSQIRSGRVYMRTPSGFSRHWRLNVDLALDLIAVGIEQVDAVRYSVTGHLQEPSIHAGMCTASHLELGSVGSAAKEVAFCFSVRIAAFRYCPAQASGKSKRVGRPVTK